LKVTAKYLMTAVMLLAGFVGLAMSLCSGITVISLLAEGSRGISSGAILFLAIPLSFLALGAGIVWKSFKVLQKLFKVGK
jgi:hypothetical protein